MRLEEPFYRLPLRFDSEALAAEIGALPEEAWIPHPQRFAGNDYVPLVTPSGVITNEFAGPMAATRFLKQCPYMMEIMATLDCVWGRARLMGLVPGSTVPPHVDTNYYWRTHTRVHIPIITNPDVSFTCGDDTVRMKAGECWIFDTFRKHSVANGGQAKRVHLVADTVGGERLWDLLHAAKSPGMQNREPDLVSRGSTGGGRLRFERANFPTLMTPWEIRVLVNDILERVVPAEPLETVRILLERMTDSWSSYWAEFESDPAGLPYYRQLAVSTLKALHELPTGSELVLTNGVILYSILNQAVFENVIESDRVRQSKAAALAASDQRIAS